MHFWLFPCKRRALYKASGVGTKVAFVVYSCIYITHFRKRKKKTKKKEPVLHETRDKILFLGRAILIDLRDYFTIKLRWLSIPIFLYFFVFLSVDTRTHARRTHDVPESAVYVCDNCILYPLPPCAICRYAMLAICYSNVRIFPWFFRECHFFSLHSHPHWYIDHFRRFTNDAFARQIYKYAVQ